MSGLADTHPSPKEPFETLWLVLPVKWSGSEGENERGGPAGSPLVGLEVDARGNGFQLAEALAQIGQLDPARDCRAVILVLAP